MIKVMKKEIKKLPKKFTVLTMIFAMLFCYFAPVMNIFAVSETTSLSVSFRGNNNQYGKVQYSLNDGATWNDITENTNELSISVSGDNLRLKIVANNGYVVDYTGIELGLGEMGDTDLSDFGFESDNGYSVPAYVEAVSLSQVEFREEGNPPGDDPVYTNTAHVTLKVIGEEIENPYEPDASEIRVGLNDCGFTPIAMDNFTATYVTVGGEQRIATLTTINPLEVGYNDVSEDTVIVGIRAQWNTFLTDVSINGVSYADQLPKNKQELIDAYQGQELRLFFEVNKTNDDNYNVEVTGRKQTSEEIIMGNFLWDYNKDGYTGPGDKILHANLEFIKAEYDNVTYNSIEAVNEKGGLFNWHNAERKGTYLNDGDGVGSATFQVGKKLTVAIIPDSGYQLINFGVNEGGFAPQEEIGVYTFEIEGGNFHLQATVDSVDNEVDVSKSNAIRNGNIEFGGKENSMSVGTARLDIEDIDNLAGDRREAFEQTASEYDINDYLDVSLFNTVFKGSRENTWDTSVSSLSNKAIITLELEENMSGKDIVIVHEKHDDDEVTGYELIDAIYNENNNTVTFETDSFSNYAIASKEASEKIEYTIKDVNGNEIKFKNGEGHNYILTIVDYLNYSKEELVQEYDVNPDEYDLVLNTLKNKTSNYGDLLSLFEIIVTDENDREVNNGPFTIKIKMTDKMKKYNTFKIMYLDDELNIESPITLNVEGDYLVGSIPHLSKYVLTGSVTKNPQTGDNIMFYASVLGFSLIGLTTAIYTRKKLLNK